MKIATALIQLQFAGHAAQLDAIVKLISELPEHTQLVILPELHNSHYFCQEQNSANFQLAETIPGRTSQVLLELSAAKNLVIVGSIFEKAPAGNYFNTAIVCDHGKLAGKYRKMHIPDDPGYNEKFYFTPGDLGFKPIATSLGKLGVLICWDQWFPEAARIMVLNGADLLIYPTAIGWDPNMNSQQHQQELDAWRTIQRSHAIANGTYVLSCNRTGFEKPPTSYQHLAGIDFWGNSFVCAPNGEIIAAAQQEPQIFYAELDLNKNTETKQLWPFLRDRRKEYYQDLI